MRSAILTASLMLASSVGVADEPRLLRDRYGDPLPQHAIARLGTMLVWDLAAARKALPKGKP